MTGREQTPTLKPGLFEQGKVQAQAGDLQTALETFNQLIEQTVNDAEAYGHRCVVRYRLGDHSGAIADCQHAAHLYAQQGQLERHQYTLSMLRRLI